MTDQIKIVGIGGLPRSGKDSLADLFIERGYFGFSFGDATRVFSRKRHSDKKDPISRANMTETSNWLRETYGPDVLLVEALKQYSEAAKHASYQGIVLYSIRAPVEVDYILSHHGRLIWVEASDQVRYDRAMANIRVGEVKISLAEFKRQEGEQWIPQPGIPIEVQMAVSYVKDNATDNLENNGSLEEFKTKAQDLITKITNLKT